MTLLHRNHLPSPGYTRVAEDEQVYGDSQHKGMKRPKALALVAVKTLALIATIHVIAMLLLGDAARSSNSSKTSIVEQEIVDGVDIRFVMVQATESQGQKVSDGSLYAGPHEVWLSVPPTCQYPQFWLRLVGDALVGVLLVEEKKSLWKGTFIFPMSGIFTVDARWYGCDPVRGGDLWTPLSGKIQFKVRSISTSINNDLKNGDFAKSAWISTEGMQLETYPQASYVWAKPSKEIGPTEKVIYLPETAVVVQGTASEPNGFYHFHDLGNYEIVCFMGSKSMSDIRDKFLALRPSVSGAQRPFKFHYYNVTDLSHPDKSWDLETKKRVRKCKHILLSIDEPEQPMSQSIYREKIRRFVGHLLKLMNDETFPIWIFTVNEPPMVATNCLEPVMRRSTDHPCNDVLKDLFVSHSFPNRVHLLDNTDLTLPMFEEGRDDILAVIALRVFVIVGKQVMEWRAMGQRGMIDGLHRNGTVEANFELIPYNGWY